MVKKFIKDWQRRSDFYKSVDLIVTIKSFDLQAIRQRYLRSKQNTSGKSGSVERRKVSLGGLAHLKITGGELEVKSLIKDLREPRGIAQDQGRLAISLEDRVLIFEDGRSYQLQYPWFSYIHTLNFHPSQAERILVTSSGFDSFFEFDFRSGKLLKEWFSWEHGLDIGHNKEGEEVRITRDKEVAKSYKNQGLAHLFIADPGQDHLPTAQRAAFINTARYADEESVYCTLFHEGTLRRVEIRSGDSEILLSGMKSPHGGQKLSNGPLLCTNTAGGEVWLKMHGELECFSFQGLAGKAPEMEGVEWIQNTLAHEGIFISIDANRNTLVVFDPEKECYDLLPFDPNWAIQDLEEFQQSVDWADLDAALK